MRRIEHDGGVRRAGWLRVIASLCVCTAATGAGGAACHMDPLTGPVDCWDEMILEGLHGCLQFCPDGAGPNGTAPSSLEKCRDAISTTGMMGCLNDLACDPPEDCVGEFLDMLAMCDSGNVEDQITCTGDYDSDPGARDACENLATTFFEWCEGTVPSATWSDGTIEDLTRLHPGSRQELWIDSTDPAIDRFELRLYRLGAVPDGVSREIALGTTSVVGRFPGLDAHAADVSLSGLSLRAGEPVFIVAEAYAGESTLGVLTFRSEMGFHPDDLNRDGRVDAADLFEALHDPDIEAARLERIIHRVLMRRGQ